MFGRTKEFRQLICLCAVLDKDSLTPVGKTGRVELMQVIDLLFYRQFKTDHAQKAYLSVDINKYVKNALVKFRFGISSIAVRSLRYKLHLYSDTICPLCRASVESEVHFTRCCSVLNDLRERFIPGKFCIQPSSFRLVLLLSTENKNIIKNVAIFLYLAFKRREIAVNYFIFFLYVNIHPHVYSSHIHCYSSYLCMTTIRHYLYFLVYISSFYIL